MFSLKLLKSSINATASTSRSVVQSRSIHVEAKLKDLGLNMPSPAVPKGNFTQYVRIGNLVYLSGHLPQVSTLRFIIYITLSTAIYILRHIYLPT